VFTSAEIESFCSESSVEKLEDGEKLLIQQLVGGQYGQDPQSTKVQDLVPLLTQKLCHIDFLLRIHLTKMLQGFI